MKQILVTAVFVTALGVFDSASAQPQPFVAVNGVYQATSTSFGDTKTFRLNAEDARFETDYEVKGGPAIDVAGGAFLWHRLGFGVGVTRFTHSTPAIVSASIPHPFFFSRPRSIAGDAGGFSREELALHLQARALLPLTGKIQAMAFGGPSFFRVSQKLTTNVRYAEAYPFDVATFQGVDSTSAEESRIGFNVGADVEYFFMRRIGVGGTVQFSRASVDLPSASGSTVSVDAGGAQVGAGIRLRF